MKKIRFLLVSIIVLFLASCESDQERITRTIDTYISSILPYNAGVEVISFSEFKEDEPTHHYKTDVTFGFVEKGDSLSGHGNMTIVFDKEKKKILGHVSYPGYICLDEKSPYQYTVISAETANAYNYSKRMIAVRIYERLPENALSYLSERLVYEYGLFVNHLNISYYADEMSLNGPNYALCDVNTTTSSFICDTQLNPLTATLSDGKANVSKNTVAQKAPYEGCPVVGIWQFIGPSKLVIYQKGGTYYMVTEENGTYTIPDKLVKISYKGYTSFKYVEDTGEIFSIHPDGLYGYADGNLASVFNKI